MDFNRRNASFRLGNYTALNQFTNANLPQKQGNTSKKIKYLPNVQMQTRVKLNLK